MTRILTAILLLVCVAAPAADLRKLPEYPALAGANIDPANDLVLVWDANGGAGGTGAFVSVTPNALKTSMAIAGGGDFSSNTATSVDGEVMLFSATTGKLGKRATTSGIAKLTAGVLSAALAGTDYYNPGGTDVAVADGGTGSSTAAGARTNLGLVIGTDVQAEDSDLDAIALLTTTAWGRGFLDDANAAATINAMGGVAGTWGADLGGTGRATLTSNGVLYGVGSSPVGVTTAGSAYQPLRVPSIGGAPAFGALDISQSAAVTGVLQVANGGTGAGTAYGGFDALSVHGADVASAPTIDLDAATGNVVDVTGTTTITTITLANGRHRWVRFTGALTLTSGSGLVLPGGSITTAAGDYAEFIGYASSVVRCASYIRTSGKSVIGPAIATDVTGLGTGVATALGVATNSAGGLSPIDGTATLTNKTISGASNTLSNVPNSALTTAVRTETISKTISGNGAAIVAGAEGDIRFDYDCTILGVTLLADVSGSIVVDLWKDTYANYPPTVADTITASALPTITSATKANDTTLSGWTSSVTAGDIIRLHVNSASTMTRCGFYLKVQK